MVYFSTSSSVIASLIPNSTRFLSCWLRRRCSKAPSRLQCKETGSTTSNQPSFDRPLWSCPLYFCRTLVSCSNPLARIQGTGAKKILIGVMQYTHLAFKARFLFTFAYRICNGFISPACTDFSSISFVSFELHWFTHMRQTAANIGSFFISSFAQLPMLYSDSLLCFFLLLILKHAEFLLRHIDLYRGNSCLPRKVYRASHLKCAPGYQYYDILVLIIGKPNTPPKTPEPHACDVLSVLLWLL